MVMVNILVGHKKHNTQVEDDTNIGMSIEANGGSHTLTLKAPMLEKQRALLQKGSKVPR